MLLHPDLAHAGGPNLSDGIRYAVYFRLRRADWAEASGAELHRGDMWSDLPGVRDLALRLLA